MTNLSYRNSFNRRIHPLTRREFIAAMGGACALPLIAGCGGGSGNSGSGSRVVVSPDTVVVPSDGSVTLSDITDTSVKVNGAMPSLRPGSVLFSSEGEGLARRVKTVTTAPGGVILETAHAGFGDIFEEATISFDRSFKQSDFAPPGPFRSRGLAFRHSRFEDDITFPLEFQRFQFGFDDGEAKTLLELNGSMPISLHALFDSKVVNRETTKLDCVGRLSTQANMTITLKVRGEFKPNPIALLPRPLQGVTFGVPVGPLVIPVTPEVQFTVEGKGFVEAGIQVSANYQGFVEAGVRYTRGSGVDGILDGSLTGNLLSSANVYNSFVLEGTYPNVEVAFKILRVIGPVLKIKPCGLELEHRLPLLSTDPQATTTTLSYVASLAGSLKGALIGETNNYEIQLAKEKVKLWERKWNAGNSNITVD